MWPRLKPFSPFIPIAHIFPPKQTSFSVPKCRVFDTHLLPLLTREATCCNVGSPATFLPVTYLPHRVLSPKENEKEKKNENRPGNPTPIRHAFLSFPFLLSSLLLPSPSRHTLPINFFFKKICSTRKWSEPYFSVSPPPEFFFFLNPSSHLKSSEPAPPHSVSRLGDPSIPGEKPNPTALPPPSLPFLPSSGPTEPDGHGPEGCSVAWRGVAWWIVVSDCF